MVNDLFVLAPVGVTISSAVHGWLASRRKHKNEERADEYSTPAQQLHCFSLTATESFAQRVNNGAAAASGKRVTVCTPAQVDAIEGACSRALCNECASDEEHDACVSACRAECTSSPSSA